MLNYTYLATDIDIQEFGPGDIAKYRYLGFFDLGDLSERVGDHELGLIHVTVSNFLGHECLFVAKEKLFSPDAEGTFLRSVFSIFDPPESMERFVALVTVLDEVNVPLYLSPIYLEIDVSKTESSRYCYLKAVTLILDELKWSLNKTLLERLELPRRGPKDKGFETPNSFKIRELRGEVSQELLAESTREVSKNRTVTLTERSIQNAENFHPMERKTLVDFQHYFDVPIEDLCLDRVALNRDFMRELLRETGRTRRQLAKEFRLESEAFFYALEFAETVPTSVLRFVRKLYGDVLGRDISTKRLIDQEKTQAIPRP